MNWLSICCCLISCSPCTTIKMSPAANCGTKTQPGRPVGCRKDKWAPMSCFYYNSLKADVYPLKDGWGARLKQKVLGENFSRNVFTTHGWLASFLLSYKNIHSKGTEGKSSTSSLFLHSFDKHIFEILNLGRAQAFESIIAFVIDAGLKTGFLWLRH